MLSTIQKCHSDLSRLTLTTAATSQQQFVQEANRVYMMTQSGAFDYDTAMKDAADALAKRGITTVQYENGKPVTRSIESAVRMNILTSVSQTAANMTLNNCEAMDCDLVETSAHIGARPEHEEWQGQIFSRSGNSEKYRPFSVCGLGSPTGICGINCRHSFHPYFEGMERHYTQDDLDEMAGEKVSFNGREMTRYEGEQKLRGMERKIRAYKRRSLTEEAAGVDNTEARRKLGEWQTAARDFTRQTGIARDSAREYVGTTGKQPTALKPLAKPATETLTPTKAVKEYKHSYGNADTIEKAKKELSNFAEKTSVAKDMDIASMNTVTKQLEYLQNTYPTNKLESITVSGRMNSDTGAMANWSSLTINKNVKDYGKSILQPKEWAEQIANSIEKQKMKKKEYENAGNKAFAFAIEKNLKQLIEYAKYKRSNVCYKGREIETTIAHEYGHIIADQKAGQLNGRWANKAFEKTDGNPLYEKVKMIDNVYRQARANGDIYKISVYASKNSHEFFAETFAIYAMQEETLPRYILKMIEEVIE